MKCKITNKLKLKLPDILIKATAGNGKEKGKRNWEGTKGGPTTLRRQRDLADGPHGCHQRK